MNFIHTLPRGRDLAFLEARSVIARMIPGRLISAFTSALAEAPELSLLGPRQVGWTSTTADFPGGIFQPSKGQKCARPWL
jgi:hypothetical protein